MATLIYREATHPRVRPEALLRQVPRAAAQHAARVVAQSLVVEDGLRRVAVRVAARCPVLASEGGTEEL